MLPANVAALHIEPTNICTLKCPGCARTRFISQWPQHWKNHSLDIDQLLKFLDIDLNNVFIKLSGNYGDPVYHPDFLNLVQALKKRGANLSITTNGSHRSETWWQQLVDMLTVNDWVRFSVDGLPETFDQYRINGDWNSIQVGMKVAAAAQCRTAWKFIPFAYNQDSIQQVQELSQQLGIDEFRISQSDRFTEHTMIYKPRDEFLGDKHTSRGSHVVQDQHGVTPRCATEREHFISAEGYYHPCCYIANHAFRYKTVFGQQPQQWDINTHSLTQLLARAADFRAQVHQHKVCQYNCPKRT